MNPPLIAVLIGAVVGGLLWIAVITWLLGKSTSAAPVTRIAIAYVAVCALSLFGWWGDGEPTSTLILGWFAYGLAAIILRLLVFKDPPDDDVTDTFL